jgi:superfamily II DNA or RNA helicase
MKELFVVKLRDYQERAIECVYAEWDRGVSNTLVCSATGTGKSVIVSGVFERLPEGSKTLYLVHREELAEQAVQQIRRFTRRSVALEMKEHGIGKTHSAKSDIIVATVQTMVGRKKKYGKTAFQYIASDESHRMVGNTWSDTYQWFEAKHGVGFTATPHRHSGESMGTVFDTVAFNYSIMDATRDGWLVPFRWKVHRLNDLDLDSIDRSKGDFAVGQLDKALAVDPVVREVVARTIEAAGEKQAMIFCAGVQQATAVTNDLKRRGKTVMLVTGSTPTHIRRENFRRAKNLEFQFIVNVACLIEGFDAPSVGVVAMTRTTNSWSQWMQMAGRGSRTWGDPVGETPAERQAWIAASEKPDCLLLEFVGRYRVQHQFRSAVDLLGGTYDDDVREEAVRLVQDMDGVFDPEEIVRQAKENVASRPPSEKRVIVDRAAEKQWTMMMPLFVNPYDVFGLSRADAVRAVPDVYGGRAQKAREFLEENKVPARVYQRLTAEEQVYFGRHLWWRQEHGLSGYPVSVRLWLAGWDVEKMTRGRAGMLMSELKGAGWLRPEQYGPNVRFLRSRGIDIPDGSV